MKTIVINTSEEARKTGLYDLFKAPFDEDALLWYEISLDKIAEMPEIIKQRLIMDTDVVDRDYHLIVLVDLNKFPFGNGKEALDMYKALVSQYMCVMVVNKLHKQYNLAPKGASVYYIDSAKKEGGFDLSKLPANTEEQMKAENELARIAEERASHPSKDKEGNLCDDGHCERVTASRTVEQKRLMELFSWTEDSYEDWTLKISVTEDLSIDFSETFETIRLSVEKSVESADRLGIILSEVMRYMSAASGDWRKTAVVVNPGLVKGVCEVCSISCTIKRDNEQSKVEGYFGIFANIFTCIRDEKLNPVFEEYDKDEIRELLVNALKKYKYFMSDERIKLKFEYIGVLFKVKERIYKKRKEASRNVNGNDNDIFSGDDSAAVADHIMSNTSEASGTVGEEELKNVNKHRLFGLDKTFYTLLEEVFAGHDPDVIRSQNSMLVKNCLARLWKWRDKQTEESFRATVKREVAEYCSESGKDALISGDGDELVDDNNIEMALNVDECENEYTDLINKITGAQHLLASNENVLLEAKNLIVKYTDLMRKSRFYLIAAVGAVLAVAAAVLPFVYVMHYSASETLVHKGLYAIYLTLFIALYMLGSSIYLAKIAKKKRAIIDELNELKKLSEEERRASIIALHQFYTDTVINAENHWLFWKEIFRRKRENERKGAMRNSHKMNLQKLINIVGGFMTMLKLGINTDQCEADEEDIKEYTKKNLELRGEETFYTEGNRRIYSFLPVVDNDGEGGEAR